MVTEDTTIMCEVCNKEKVVQYVKDPYLLDMYSEHKYIWICEECYKRLCDDI